MRIMLTSAFLAIASVCFAQQPPNCAVGGFIISPNSTIWVCQGAGSAATQVPASGATWGGITGTLSTQTDLQTALNGKISTGGLAGSATALATARAINGVAFDGTAPITVAAAGSTLTDNVTYARGGLGACAATSATTGTITVNMTTPCITVTPTGAMQFNASGGVAGQIAVFSITTAGAASFVLTWGTNFRKTGTLATGVTAARFFTVVFYCLDGSTWTEISRTAVQS